MEVYILNHWKSLFLALTLTSFLGGFTFLILILGAKEPGEGHRLSNLSKRRYFSVAFFPKYLFVYPFLAKIATASFSAPSFGPSYTEHMTRVLLKLERLLPGEKL